MAIKDTLKFYCCTLQGLLRLKLIIGLILGLLIMLAAILTLINPVALINPFNYLRQVWNAVFGFLILAAQPGWQKIPICSKILGRFVSRFGFLNHWLGRGLFYLLCAPPLSAATTTHHSPLPLPAARSVGTAAMNPDAGQEFSFVIGFALIFMAIVELCTGRYFDRKAQKEGGGGGGGGAGGAPSAPYESNWPPGGRAPSSRDEGAPPVPTSDTPRLPDGWKPAVDASGNTYYYNEATGGSSWSVPTS